MWVLGLAKVSFYVAGGVLAAWAVVVSVLGFRQADFPGNLSRTRAVIGLSVALVLAATGLAVATSKVEKGKEATKAEPAARAPGPKSSATTTLALAADPGGNLAYDRKTLTAKAGTVVIDFANKSSVPHNVTIAKGPRKAAASRTITSSTTKLRAPLKPGSYAFYCSVDGHRQGGMQGTLTVR